MSENVRKIGDVAGEERANTRAITEILVKLGTLEGEVATLRGEVRMANARITAVDAELEGTLAKTKGQLKQMRTLVGRAVSAAARVNTAQDLIKVLARKLHILDESSKDLG